MFGRGGFLFGDECDCWLTCKRGWDRARDASAILVIVIVGGCCWGMLNFVLACL